MKALSIVILGVLLTVPRVAAAATIPFDVCTSFDFSACGGVSLTIRAFEGTGRTVVSVDTSGARRIVNDALAFGFWPAGDPLFITPPNVAVTNNPVDHPRFGAFPNSIDFLIDTPTISGFSFTFQSMDGSMILNPFAMNFNGNMAFVHIRNIETGAESFQGMRLFPGQQAEVIPMAPAAVPEPGTLMLVATGLAAAWRARRRGSSPD
jgi:hypothetical protein